MVEEILLDDWLFTLQQMNIRQDQKVNFHHWRYHQQEHQHFEDYVHSFQTTIQCPQQQGLSRAIKFGKSNRSCQEIKLYTALEQPHTLPHNTAT